MTRGKWVDEVVKPWKKGDITQKMFPGGIDGWKDYSEHDPVQQCPDFEAGYTYRIKPRTVKWVIELPESDKDISSFFDLVGDRLAHTGYNIEYVNAIRNAKLLGGI